MKKSVILISLLSIVLYSCNSGSYKTVAYAHGQAGDIIVVMNNQAWDTEAGDSLRKVFHEYVSGVPMEEHMFDLHQIPREQFVKGNKLHRNVIYQEVNSSIEQASIKISRNKFAMKQVFVEIAAPNQHEFAKIVAQNKKKLVDIFLEADKARWIETLTKYTNKIVSKRVQERFDIFLRIPSYYNIEEDRDGFMWICKEAKNYSTNILIYSWEKSDTSVLTAEYLISMRNLILQNNIPGEKPNSYMTTETKYDYPQFSLLMHNSMQTGKLRGLWRVHGDFMGGPFVSYTKIDEPRNRLVTVEGFVYRPNQEVRDLIRELEWTCSTFDITF